MLPDQSTSKNPETVSPSITYGAKKKHNMLFLTLLKLMTTTSRNIVIGEDSLIKPGTTQSYIHYCKERYHTGSVSDWEAIGLYVKYLARKLKNPNDLHLLVVGVMSYQVLRYTKKVDTYVFVNAGQLLTDVKKYRYEKNWTRKIYLPTLVGLVENFPKKHILTSPDLSELERMLPDLNDIRLTKSDLTDVIDGDGYEKLFELPKKLRRTPFSGELKPSVKKKG